LKKEYDQWKKNKYLKGLKKSQLDQIPHTTISGKQIKELYIPDDLKNLDYKKDLSFPGEYPYTRGIHATMYHGRQWTMRQFSGFGSAEDTNKRYKYLLKQGQNVSYEEAIEQAKTQTTENSFQDIFMPSMVGQKNDFSSETNSLRVINMYDNITTEDIVINGKPDKELVNQKTKEWVEAIKNGVETQKNYVSFELVPKGNDKYVLKATGISPELNKYGQVYINAVVIENVANTTFQGDYGQHDLAKYSNGMSTIRNLVREWLFKDKKTGEGSERGESFFIKNGETISKNIELFDIPPKDINKYSVVAWAQVNDGKYIAQDAEILSAAVCSLNEGKVLKFNWNNWPKNMQDENLMVKPEYHMPLGLGEMNLNLENAENLKKISFDINDQDYKIVYRIIGVKPNPDLYDITFDQKCIFNQNINYLNLIFKQPFLCYNWYSLTE